MHRLSERIKQRVRISLKSGAQTLWLSVIKEHKHGWEVRLWDSNSLTPSTCQRGHAHLIMQTLSPYNSRNYSCQCHRCREYISEVWERIAHRPCCEHVCRLWFWALTDCFSVWSFKSTWDCCCSRPQEQWQNDRETQPMAAEFYYCRQRCEKLLAPSRFLSYLHICHTSMFQIIKPISILVNYNLSKQQMHLLNDYSSI